MNDYIVLFYDFLLHSPYKRYGTVKGGLQLVFKPKKRRKGEAGIISVSFLLFIDL